MIDDESVSISLPPTVDFFHIFKGVCYFKAFLIQAAYTESNSQRGSVMQPEERIDYEVANGPDGLRALLDELWERAQQTPGEFMILYQVGEQKSLIKVDARKQPFEFWYHDLMGRSPTNAVKTIIGTFLWERCGEKERYQDD